MALSDTQQIAVCQILNVMPYQLTFQIGWLGARLTSAMETEIGNQITTWNAGASTDFTDIHPNDKNFGAKIDAERQRNAIRQRIAVLLEWSDMRSGTSLVRG